MAKSTEQQLIDLINLKNNQLQAPLTLEDVDFGEGVANYQPTEPGSSRNAQVTLTARPTSANFTGSKVFHYTRIPGVNVLGPQTYNVATAEELEKNNDQIVAILNELIQKRGWVDDEFAVGEVIIAKGAVTESTALYNCNVKGGNLKFQPGSLCTLTLRVVTDMSTLNSELDGFTPA
nr:MAG TPA: Putative virion structural protein [Caudoviricetes sp.]